jgi:hypothetical protein
MTVSSSQLYIIFLNDISLMERRPSLPVKMAVQGDAMRSHDNTAVIPGPPRKIDSLSGLIRLLIDQE